MMTLSENTQSLTQGADHEGGQKFVSAGGSCRIYKNRSK